MNSKTTKLFLLSALTLTLGTAATAAGPQEIPAAGLGDWQGTGVSYGLTGEERTRYTVELRRTQTAPGVTEVTGKVTLATGQVFPITERVTGGPSGFKVETNRGSGGGRCVGADFCLVYEDIGNGKAFASTVVIDDETHLRVLTTELLDGQAVGFSSQALTRR